MLGGGTAMMLDNQGTLYVSESLQETFALQPEAEGRYRLEFVAGG